jgi:2-methylcitrate dehydratase PrpD
MLVLGGVRLAAFAPERLVDPAIHTLMALVSVSLAPDLANAYPGKRAARVTITLRNGTILERYQPTRKGDPDAPLSDADLAAKFRELAGPVIGEKTETLLDALWTGTVLPGAL